MHATRSGQQKHAETEIGRNQNKCLRKAEALAETEASAETFISAKIYYFCQTNVLASQFILYPSLLLKLTENSTNTARTCWKEEERLKISGLPSILFWPKQSFWPKHPLLAEKHVSAKLPKEKKAERPKPKHILAENFGRNRTETVFG